MTPKITDSVLKQIADQQVTQKPVWYFWAQTGLFVIGGLIFFIIGMLASTSLFLLLGDLPAKALLRSHSLLKLILLGFPIIWILISIALGSLAVFMSRQTEGAYRYRWPWVLVVVLLLQTAFGYGLAESNFGDRVEHFVGRKLHQEHRMQAWRDQAWRQPKSGLLAGEVQSFNDQQITILSRHRGLWIVDISQAKQVKSLQIEPGIFIRFHGSEDTNNHLRKPPLLFTADKVMVGRHKPKFRNSRRDQKRFHQSR